MADIRVWVALAPHLSFPKEHNRTLAYGFFRGIFPQQPLADQLLLPPRLPQGWGQRNSSVKDRKLGGTHSGRSQGSPFPTPGRHIRIPLASSSVRTCLPLPPAAPQLLHPARQRPETALPPTPHGAAEGKLRARKQKHRPRRLELRKRQKEPER